MNDTTTTTRSTTMTCRHENTTLGIDRPYQHPVARDEHVRESAHGGVTFAEVCDDCGSVRAVNSNGRYQE